VIEGRIDEQDDERLEVAGIKVYQRRDVVSVRDVHVATSEGVSLRVQVSALLCAWKPWGLGDLTVYELKV
jgi:hypothetical protein